MFNIASYLSKFKDLGLSDRLLKDALVFSIKEIVGVDILVKNISLKNGEVVIKVSPTIKNAIYIKKDKILKSVEEKIGKGVSEIR